MFYVRRKQNNKIESISTDKNHSSEELPLSNPEILEFLAGTTESERKLIASDLGFIRVLEDLIEILVSKNIISYYDLPKSAVDKLSNRVELRIQQEKELSIKEDDKLKY